MMSEMKTYTLTGIILSSMGAPSTFEFYDITLFYGEGKESLLLQCAT